MFPFPLFFSKRELSLLAWPWVTKPATEGTEMGPNFEQKWTLTSIKENQKFEFFRTVHKEVMLKQFKANIAGIIGSQLYHGSVSVGPLHPLYP